MTASFSGLGKAGSNSENCVIRRGVDCAATALLATPVAGKRQEPDGWLQVDHTGAKTSQHPGKW